jgi:hypothetical protein
MPLGLLHIRSDLGQEFIERHPSRSGQTACLLKDLLPDLLGNLCGRGNAFFVLGNIQEGFI